MPALKPHHPVSSKVSFPALEEQVLERWRNRDIFAKSVANREGRPRWSFYEGPPTANGAPGSHHVLSRSFKDIFTRYRTMAGNYVERKAGWDCHGLPVELAVEKELGFKAKSDIERYGIEKFNARCRQNVLSHIEDWSKLTERIGFWVDTEHAYKTLDPSYVESVWWALKTIHEKGLLYQKLKVVPYCPRCGTALSSHELGQPGVYQDVVDTSAYVILPLVDEPAPAGTGNEQPAGAGHAAGADTGAADGVAGAVDLTGAKLVVWTTTPWTLVSNAAVAVDPELTYVRTAEGYIVAEALATKTLGEDVEIVNRFPGSELVGRHYEPPFDFITAADYGEKGHTVLPAGFVTADEGTGLVHTAIAFGEDDFQLGVANGLEPINPVLPDGTYDERISTYAGRKVKECDEDIARDLQARGKLLRAEPYEHSYPHCWRCGTALIYYAKPSWYIATSQIRDRLLASNETVNWQPPHVKDGRFGNWLEGNVDWALSRERYWGTPLPVWQCPDGHIHVVGGFDELEQLSGSRLEDPHRPYVDAVTFPCTTEGCDAQMQRVPEVIDVWFDSGSMPFAQYGSPHNGTKEFEDHFPADYICEALDQTRGWFYSLLAISTLLFDRSSYKNVVCLGLLLDENGAKMSKSKGNVVEPWDVINRFGADAFRWYLFTSKYPWDGYRFSLDTLGEAVRQFMLPLWNTYSFYALYANAAEGGARAGGPLATGPDQSGTAAASAIDASAIDASAGALDRWVLSRLAATVKTVDEGLAGFDATGAGRAIAEFVDEVSNWYVRRSRRRFWDGDEAAFTTLRTVLVTVAKLLAPFTPFVSDEIYENLDGELESVHLCDFPVAAERDLEIEQAMATARETVRLGLAARAQAKLKVRQPLAAAVIVAAGAERTAIEQLAEIVRDELNVRELRFVDNADELGEVQIKPNYRTLGPRFGKQMPLVAAAVAGLAGAHVGGALRDGQGVAIDVAGFEHALTADDLLVSMKPLAGYQVEREGSHAVALELELDESLLVEGLAREIVHAVQSARRDADLDISDRITLALDGDARLLDAARAHQEYVAGETLALSVTYGDGDNFSDTGTDGVRPDGTGHTGAATIDGLALQIGLQAV
jgi:isoleucyl-tRNA synthetase